ncbi:MAG TPA: ATP synthase F0 subunit B [Chthonomonadaceae bacterium]|nr:ATP synthase F0 subunit B [Chthonomonadaceae bacterium]
MASILHNLGFSPTVFVFQIVLFIILWIVMSKIFWDPALAHLRARDQHIADVYHTVEATRHEMETLRADYLARMAQIEAEARSHIQAAIKEAQVERERLLAEARTHAEAAIRQGVADMERDRVEALESLRGRIVHLAMLTTSKALGPSVEPETLRRSIEERVAANAAGGSA